MNCCSLVGGQRGGEERRGAERRGGELEKTRRGENREGQGGEEEGDLEMKRRGRKVKTEFIQRCTSDYWQTGLTRLGNHFSSLKGGTIEPRLIPQQERENEEKCSYACQAR